MKTIETVEDAIEFPKRRGNVLVVGADWCTSCPQQKRTLEKMQENGRIREAAYADIELVQNIWPDIQHLPTLVIGDHRLPGPVKANELERFVA